MKIGFIYFSCLFLFVVAGYCQTALIDFESNQVEIEAATNGSLFTLDKVSGVLSRYSGKGEFQFSVSGDEFAHFDDVQSLFVSSGLTVLVCDTGNQRVLLFDRNLQKIGEINKDSQAELQQWKPISAIMNELGEIWVFDSNEKRLIRFDENGYLRSKTYINDESATNESFQKSRLILSEQGYWLITNSLQKIFRFSSLGKYEFFFTPSETELNMVQWIGNKTLSIHQNSLVQLNSRTEKIQTIAAISFQTLSNEFNPSEIQDWTIHQSSIIFLYQTKLYQLPLLE